MSVLWAWVVEPMQYPFMVRALLASVAIGALCGLVGSYVVLRGMAFYGDALAHAILPGVAIGYLIGGGARGPLFWSALATAVLVALAIGAVSRMAQLKEDTAIGIIFAGMFALGIAIISTVRSYAVDLVHFLFGDVLSVSWHDVGLIAVFSLVVTAIILIFYKEFLVMTFDSTLAHTLRLPTSLLYYALLVLIAVTIVVALQIVGVALMLAMLVTPPATAYLMAKRLPVMMGLSALMGALAAVIGLYVSYYMGIASGASIVLVSVGLFLLTLIATRRHLIRR